MRTLILALLCAALALPAAAEDKKPAGAASSSQAQAKPSPADTDRALNAIGLSFAKSLETFNITPAELEKIVAGLREGASGKGKQKLEDSTTQDNLRAFVQARMAAAADKEKARGTTYYDNAAKEKGAVKTANGALVIPIKEGAGAAPTATDKVKVNYTGTLVDGKVFDSTSQHKPPAPAEFPLNGVIPCWTEALQKMKVGGHAKVICPPAIAYGDRGSPPVIPGSATLTFDIELLNVEKAPPPTSPNSSQGSTPQVGK
jgi:FKBP-type peptidyl-prolyl cis-trans isomerase